MSEGTTYPMNSGTQTLVRLIEIEKRRVERNRTRKKGFRNYTVD